MNKKQLITLWGVGLVISIVFLVTPIKEVMSVSARGYMKNIPLYVVDVTRVSFPVLIIGGLLFYTFKEKK